MVFNRFRVSVVLRVVGIILNLAVLLFVVTQTHYVMSVFVLSVILLWQIWSLIHFVERIERDLTRFLEAVKYEDFFETFSNRRSVFAKRLNEEFTRIMDDFRVVRAQREEQMLYLQTVVQHVGIALLAYDPDGEVDLVNSAAKRLFRVNRLRNVRQLGQVSEELVRTLFTLRPGQQKVVKVMDEGDLLQLAVRATEFKRQGRRLLLVSIQDIGSELEEKELEAWQNLIRVLTHEIRNTITPIASLASTTEELLEQETNPGATGEILEDAKLAVQTIRKRSRGLLNFVEAFRSLYKIPKPNLTRFEISEFFDHLQALFRQTCEERGIETHFTCNPSAFELIADRDLIEQVMINLITNALQALEGVVDSRLNVTAMIDSRGRARLSVQDNGPGISEDVFEKIFVPFFTTKPEGTGIGLSLSRQIVRLHKGMLSAQSRVGEGATFHLTL
ncbi:MAG: ATP-binding protein [bacterium]